MMLTMDKTLFDWETLEPTNAQLDYIRQLRKRLNSKEKWKPESRGEASDLIDELLIQVQIKEKKKGDLKI